MIIGQSWCGLVIHSPHGCCIWKLFELTNVLRTTDHYSHCLLVGVSGWLDQLSLLSLVGCVAAGW